MLKTTARSPRTSLEGSESPAADSQQATGLAGEVPTLGELPQLHARQRQAARAALGMQRPRPRAEQAAESSTSPARAAAAELEARFSKLSAREPASGIAGGAAAEPVAGTAPKFTGDELDRLAAGTAAYRLAPGESSADQQPGLAGRIAVESMTPPTLVDTSVALPWDQAAQILRGGTDAEVRALFESEPPYRQSHIRRLSQLYTPEQRATGIPSAVERQQQYARIHRLFLDCSRRHALSIQDEIRWAILDAAQTGDIHAAIALLLAAPDRGHRGPKFSKLADSVVRLAATARTEADVDALIEGGITSAESMTLVLEDPMGPLREEADAYAPVMRSGTDADIAARFRSDDPNLAGQANLMSVSLVYGSDENGAIEAPPAADRRRRYAHIVALGLQNSPRYPRHTVEDLRGAIVLAAEQGDIQAAIALLEEIKGHIDSTSFAALVGEVIALCAKNQSFAKLEALADSGIASVPSAEAVTREADMDMLRSKNVDDVRSLFRESEGLAEPKLRMVPFMYPPGVGEEPSVPDRQRQYETVCRQYISLYSRTHRQASQKVVYQVACEAARSGDIHAAIAFLNVSAEDPRERGNVRRVRNEVAALCAQHRSAAEYTLLIEQGIVAGHGDGLHRPLEQALLHTDEAESANMLRAMLVTPWGRDALQGALVASATLGMPTHTGLLLAALTKEGVAAHGDTLEPVLAAAARHGHEVILGMLLDFPALKNKHINGRRDALQLALQGGHTACADRLRLELKQKPSTGIGSLFGR